MPGWPLVLGHVENQLTKGVDDSRADAIYRYITDNGEDVTTKKKQQLARVSELLLPNGFFTAGGEAAWNRLTGIRREKAKVVYPADFLEAGKVHHVRAQLKKDHNRISEKYTIRRAKGGRKLLRIENSGFSVDEVARRREPHPFPHASLTMRQAQSLALPRPAVDAAVEALGTQLGVAQQMYLKLVEAENDGYADDKLSASDVEAIGDPTISGIMKVLYGKVGGEHSVPLPTVKRHLPAAITEFFCGGRRGWNRTRPEHERWYATLSQDVVSFLAHQYWDQVFNEGIPYTPLLESWGFVKPREKGRIQPILQKLVPPPTLDQIERLYNLACDGKLSDLDFYGATGLGKQDVFQLQAALPERFERKEGMKGQAAIPVADRSPGKMSQVELRSLWNSTNDKDLLRFCRDHGLRYNRVMHLRRKGKVKLDIPAPRVATGGNPEFEAERALALRAAMDRAFKVDVLYTIDEAIEVVNRDKKYTSIYGKILTKDYYRIRLSQSTPAADGGVANKVFPNYQMTAHWYPVIAKEIRAIMKGPHAPKTRPLLLKRLQKDHPNLARNQLDKFALRRLDVPVPGRDERRTNKEVRQLAQYIAKRLKAGADRDAIVTELQRKGNGDIDLNRLNGIIASYKKDYFLDVPGVREPKHYQAEYTCLAARRMLDLAIAVAPPGTSQEKLAEAWNKLLGKAGLPPRDMSTIEDRLRVFANPAPNKVFARTAAKIVAEYAHAAGENETEEDIFRKVKADYPSITDKDIGTFRRFWNRSPGDYPELGDELRGSNGKVRLVGLEDPVDQPRFIGGWDIERVVAGASEDEQVAFAKLSEAAHVALALDDIEYVLDLVGDSKPLALRNVLWVSHMVADIPATAFALKKLGATQDNTIVVSSPYGDNELVGETVREIKFDKRTPKLTEGDDEPNSYRSVVRQAIIDLIKRHIKNGRGIRVMDDGGLVTDIIHSELRHDPKYRKYQKYLDEIEVVEQTKQGQLLAEKGELRNRVVGVPTADIKEVEGDAIGQVIAAHVIRKLATRTGKKKGFEIVVFGHGIIGGPIARLIKALGGRLTVIETSEAAADNARALGYAEVIRIDPNYDKAGGRSNLKKAIGKADYIVGASGSPEGSMKVDMFGWMKDGASWANVSSKRTEGEVGKLEKIAKKEFLKPTNPLETLRSAKYTLPNGRSIYIDGDGWPFTLNGTVQHVPPRRIQSTAAAMLWGLMQICRAPGKPGLDHLDPEVDEELCARAMKRDFSDLEIYDADAWLKTLRDVGSIFVEKAHPARKKKPAPRRSPRKARPRRARA